VKGYEAEKFRPYLRLTYGAGDMAVVQIVQPAGEVLGGSAVEPKVVVQNNGDLELPFQLTLTLGDGTNNLYRESVQVAGVPVGQSAEVQFPQWVADEVGGERQATAKLDMLYDADLSNNLLLSWFDVYVDQQGGGNGGGEPPTPPAVHWGWQEVTRVPALPSARPVKAGGLLLCDPATGIIYAAKGNRTGEFAAFDPLTGKWRQLAPIPGTQPGKGARGVADGSGGVFLVKGSSTVEFWRYDIAGNAWERLPDIPLGTSGKTVTGGTGMAHVVQYGLDYIYLLKGPKQDFARYNEQARAWTVLSDAPAGSKAKWGRGSWLVCDGAGRLYAHKAAANELWYYDLATDAWGTQLPGMPLYGSSLRPKKSKDGGSGAWREGTMFALKGSKTGEFWAYDATGWHEFEPMPARGTTQKNVLPGPGADLVSYPFGRVLFALKGNKTLEFWRYTMKPLEVESHGPADQGVMSAAVRSSAERLVVTPNPAFGRVARLQYAVPASGPAMVTLFDACGRVAAQEEFDLARSGSVELRLADLSAGTYIVRLEGGRYSATGRLVVTR